MLSIVVFLLLCYTFIFFLMPHIQAFMLKRKYGSLEKWHEKLEREDSLPTNSLLYANNDFWGNTSAANYKHEIAADDIVFASNDIIKVDNNLYIIGCYGVTDWCMILGLYSRGGQFQKHTTIFQDEFYNWNFFIHALDAEETEFPFQDLMFISVTKLSNSMVDLKALKANKERFDKVSTTFEKQRVLNNQNKGIFIKNTQIKTPDGRVLYKGSLSIGEKGLYIIKGANETGKSTLLRAIIGNLSPEQVDGEIYVSTNLLENVSFLRYPLFLFNDNVLQNIKGAPNLQKEIEIHKVLKFNPPSLDKEIKLDPLNLSSGETQKIVLLREISKESSMILLDEPTTNLDSEAIYELKNYVGKEKNNKLILLIMHDDSFDNIADDFIFIKDKKLWMENANV